MFYAIMLHCGPVVAHSEFICQLAILLDDLLLLEMPILIQYWISTGDLLGLDRMIYCTLSLQMQLNTFFKHLGQGNFGLPFSLWRL